MEVQTRLAADLSSTYVDPRELENALLNLAINARDAMPGGGCLTLTTRNLGAHELPAEVGESSDGHVEISIADDGHGMPPEVTSRAFEPFFTTKPPGQGSGLGLSQVYGFAQQSHGAVTIDSSAEHGTVIRLYLPKWRRQSMLEQCEPRGVDFSMAIAAVPER